MQEIWKKITKQSKRCFSHGFTVPEETESKPPPLAALAIAMAPLRETADLYPPSPEDEDWDKYPKMGNIEEEMHYLHICPDRGLERKNDPPLAALIPIPPRPHELQLLFPFMFNMNGNNTYNGLDMNLIKTLKRLVQLMVLLLIFVENIWQDGAIMLGRFPMIFILWPLNNEKL
jgi:hypothetical protein